MYFSSTFLSRSVNGSPHFKHLIVGFFTSTPQFGQKAIEKLFSNSVDENCFLFVNSDFSKVDSTTIFSPQFLQKLLSASNFSPQFEQKLKSRLILEFTLVLIFCSYHVYYRIKSH